MEVTTLKTRMAFLRRPWRGRAGQISERPPDGPDVLNVSVYGDSIPGLGVAALGVGRQLYGARAELAVERVGSIDSACGSKGRFFTVVRVRCLNYADLDLA